MCPLSCGMGITSVIIPNYNKICFVFARWVDLNIVLKGTFEQCSNLPFNIFMILIFILEETHGAYNHFRTRKWIAHI
jgi:hypothetical protein